MMIGGRGDIKEDFTGPVYPPDLSTKPPKEPTHGATFSTMSWPAAAYASSDRSRSLSG